MLGGKGKYELDYEPSVRAHDGPSEFLCSLFSSYTHSPTESQNFIFHHGRGCIPGRGDSLRSESELLSVRSLAKPFITPQSVLNVLRQRA